MAASTTEETRRVLNTFYEAGRQNDWARLMGCLDENIVIHEPPYLPYGGVFKGAASFPKIVEGISPYGDLTGIKALYLTVEGDRGFCVFEIPDKITGKQFRLVEESRVENGKMVEMRIYYFDAGSMIGKAANPA